MLLIFLSIHFLVTKASEVPSLRKAYFGDNITGEKVTATFLSIAFAALFAYWIYVITYPLYTLSSFARELFTVGQWGARTYAERAGISAASIRTIRGHITFYGFYSFHLIFGLILLFKLLPRAKNRRVETYSSTLFLFLSGLVGGLSLYLVRSGVYPDRFLMFGWLFGFAPLVVAILKGKHKWLNGVGVFLLIAFMIFNIYMINPQDYDPRAERVPIVTSVEDYALANTFDFSSGNIFGTQNPVMAIYDVHTNLGTVLSLSDANLTKFDWIIVPKRVLELEKKSTQELRTGTLAELEHLADECPIDYNKIYESYSYSVFKARQ